MALFTGKGDKGTTKVLDSKERFSKGSDMAEALGSLDELNSFIGLCKASARGVQEGGVKVGRRQERSLAEILHDVQENLFIVQAQVAGAPKKITRPKVAVMEGIINAIEKEIPPITGFTIAGSLELSALLDVTRTMARRAERRVVIVHDGKQRKITAHTLAYLNRLSSLLFALARLTAHRAGLKEDSPSYR